MIYLYYGENSFLIREKLARAKEAYHNKFKSGLNFFKFDLEENCGDLKMALESQSMFSEKKLIFLRGILSVPESKWDETAGILSAVGGLEKSEEVILVGYDFSAADSAALKKRLEFFNKKGKVEKFINYDQPKLIDWCLKKAAGENIKITRGDAAYLINGVGCDTDHVWNEILKLSAYGRGAITKANIDSSVVFDVVSSNFKVTDALMAKNAVLALKGLEDQWAKNEDPILILGAVVWQFRILVKLAGAKFASSEEAAKKLGLNPWVAKKSLAALKNFSAGELKNIYHNLADIDLAVKTGQRDGREALEDFVYDFLKA
ncbi:MAG: DNA polymerase III subunit delta [Parcubacteria group bacterium]|nr:DNA polymerase III subunit delta [Parcubacteria group bacterium]